jgi:hypothetical protein
MRTQSFASTMFAALVLLGCALLLIGCTLPTSPVVVTTNVSNTQGDPGPEPNDVTAPGAVVRVRAGLFGGKCPDGASVAAGASELKVGCVGYATATPLGAGDIKLGTDVHGHECAWSTDRPDVVSLLAVENPFNRDIVALRPGTARITATVKGISGVFDVVVK